VAEHLLDRNDEERVAAAGSTEEFLLNLARNVADAIDLLPKLVGTVFPGRVIDMSPCFQVFCYILLDAL